MRLKNHWLEAVVLCSALVLGYHWWHLSANARSPKHEAAFPVNNSRPAKVTKAVVAERSPSPSSLNYRIETYYSNAMTGERTYGVVLPPGYEQHPHQRYPVIFLLHGGHGNPMDWLIPQKGNVPATLQTLYHTGKLTASIVITPDGNDQRGSNAHWDPDYFDGPHGKVATAIGDELVRVIQSRYRTLPAPSAWAIGGLSSGAWGALNIGLHYPNHFGTLFSHSGYFVDKSGPQNSPIELVKTLSQSDRKHLSIYIDTGTADKRYLSQAQQFYQQLQQQGIKSAFMTFPGSHTWRFWREHLNDSLAFVEKQFQTAMISQGRKYADRQ
jgi:enterochelin esterase-like enzyme